MRRPTHWVVSYLRWAALADALTALAAGLLAIELRFVRVDQLPVAYVLLTAALSVLWCAAVGLAGGYDPRFVGVGPDEFRRIVASAVSLTAGVAIVSYALKLDVARGYVAVAMPSALLLDLTARYALRKRLHRLRATGLFRRRVVAVGHAPNVADLVSLLRRDSYHGMSVVGACLAGQSLPAEVEGVPVFGALEQTPAAVTDLDADTVAVLSCPEMDGIRLRELAWRLEESCTDLYVAPTLLDVAGPRTTIRPVAGLPLLHVDRAELAGLRQLLKTVFDRLAAAAALLVAAPVFLAVALAIRAEDGGPVFFRQIRVGREERAFPLLKFRTMAVDAERRKAELASRNESGGLLFKIHQDPRVTRVGSRLRRWSLDELPQLINVLTGDMSLVGPRPALPEETAHYGTYMRRRLVVKPGITGLWQVSGRSDLPWDEAVRLDLHYVENWSFALDLQILWKTWSAVIRGSGAY